MNQNITLNEKKSYFLMEHEGASFLEELNLPYAKSQFVISENEAVIAAKKIGYPIVLKGMSEDIVHKTEANIVKLSLRNELQIRNAYKEIVKNVQKTNSKAYLAGVLVQEMSEKGIELIFGIKKDAIFGHQLVIGFGGTLVEIMKDFSMRMMPVSESEVDEMIRELKSYSILKGYRGQEGVNIEKIKKICLGLNKLIKNKPEIEELDLNPVIFKGKEALICDVRILIGEKNKLRHEPRSLKAVEQIINPSSIAVIGASRNENKNGGRLFRYIVENNYPGKLYPVNPGAKEIRGYKAYASLNDIPEQIDLACIIVSATQVIDVMKECIEKKIKSVIIYSSGFAEIGESGEKLQNEILSVAKEGDIRVLGPNSIGIASPSKNIYTAFGAALESVEKVPGNIGFISQSGAMGSALLSRAWEKKIGFSRWITVANEMDLSATDFIEVLADDDLTKIISVFMEGLKNSTAFERASRKAFENKKPLIIYKTGRSDIGKQAVESHTGSIAGDAEVYSAAFKKNRVLQVDQVDDLIDVSVALDVQPLPKGKNIGVITASGGACSIIADLCSEKGLEVPKLTKESEKIKNLIPPFGSAENPIDLTAEVIAQPEMFKEVMQTLIDDSNIDGVVVMLTTNADPGASTIANAIIDVFSTSKKPIVLGRLGAETIAPDAINIYKNNNFPVYKTPEKAVNIMHYLVQYKELIK